MNISFDELRQIKHSLPSGSIQKIAKELSREEDEIRNFFGQTRFKGASNDWHFEQGPNGGIVSVRDTSILDAAQRILGERNR